MGASSAVLSSDALSDKVDLEDKLRIAKAYRQKLLEKQHSTGIQTRVPDGKHGHDRLDSLLYSPGMARESEANRIMKKKGREAASHDHGHGGVGLDGKSSFSQCVFNMANILMVSNSLYEYRFSVLSFWERVTHHCHLPWLKLDHMSVQTIAFPYLLLGGRYAWTSIRL